MNDLMQRERLRAESKVFSGLVVFACALIGGVILLVAACCKYAGLIDAAGKAVNQ